MKIYLLNCFVVYDCQEILLFYHRAEERRLAGGGSSNKKILSRWTERFLNTARRCNYCQLQILVRQCFPTYFTVKSRQKPNTYNFNFTISIAQNDAQQSPSLVHPAYLLTSTSLPYSIAQCSNELAGGADCRCGGGPHHYSRPGQRVHCGLMRRCSTAYRLLTLWLALLAQCTFNAEDGFRHRVQNVGQ